MTALNPGKIIGFGGDFTNTQLTTAPAHDLRDTASGLGLASVSGSDLQVVGNAVSRAIGFSITLPGNAPQGMNSPNFVNNANS